MYETIISEDKLEAIWEDVLCLYKNNLQLQKQIKFTKETNAKFGDNSTPSAAAKRSSVLDAYVYETMIIVTSVLCRGVFC